MSEEERQFYRLAQDRGEELAIARDMIDDLMSERDSLKTALKGFTDVMTAYGFVDTDELRTALEEWRRYGIPSGKTVWLVSRDAREPDNPAKMRIEAAPYDEDHMWQGIGEWVFTTEKAAAAELVSRMTKAWC